MRLLPSFECILCCTQQKKKPAPTGQEWKGFQQMNDCVGEWERAAPKPGTSQGSDVPRAGFQKRGEPEPNFS